MVLLSTDLIQIIKVLRNLRMKTYQNEKGPNIERISDARLMAFAWLVFND
jgi:hypothetical protein